jgi:hypothetical protein
MVEQTTDATWKAKKYKRKRGLLPLLELGFSAYFLCAMLYALHMEMYGTLPFLFLFFFGYGYIGLMSVLQTSSVKRLALWLRPLAARKA